LVDSKRGMEFVRTKWGPVPVHGMFTASCSDFGAEPHAIFYLHGIGEEPRGEDWHDG